MYIGLRKRLKDTVIMDFIKRGLTNAGLSGMIVVMFAAILFSKALFIIVICLLSIEILRRIYLYKGGEQPCLE